MAELVGRCRTASLHLQWKASRLHVRDPFRIARRRSDGRSDLTAVLVELRSAKHQGLVGYGECFPDRYYGETAGTVAAVLPILLQAVATLPIDAASLDVVEQSLDRAISGNNAAKAALSIALHDLAARVAGLPLPQFLGLTNRASPTDFTIGLDDPQSVRQRVLRAANFPALKMKVGGPHDIETLHVVREVYNGPVRVDANTGWTLTEAAAVLPALEHLGVELIEQPFPAERVDWMGELQARTMIPVVADESAVTASDVDRLAGVVAGINVKIAKTGGIARARAVLERAQRVGMRTMIGCTVSTSVGISAAATLAPLADWVDLDGSLLLRRDPFVGLRLDRDCRWIHSGSPGLGVAPGPE